MALIESYSLWDAVQYALMHAREKYARRMLHKSPDVDIALADLLEQTVTVQLKPGLHQHLTFTFHHRVAPRSFMYYYTLRQQADHTYRIIDVDTGSHL